MLLGIVMLFDGGLLAIGNLMFLCGLLLLIGLQKTYAFFARPQKLRGTVCFFGGIVLVFIRRPFIGMCVETFGFINLFGMGSLFRKMTGLCRGRGPDLVDQMNVYVDADSGKNRNLQATAADFFPVAISFLRKLPIIGPVLNTPGIAKVVENDPKGLESVLDGIATVDPTNLLRGHTPLTLAIALGRTECTRILVHHASSRSLALARTDSGWRPFHEATSYGDRETIRLVYESMRQELGDWMNAKGASLLAELSNDLNDFYLELQWEFGSSWLPFLGQLCPSDVCKIHKKGSSVRIDTTLVGFENLQWIRGDISIIFSESKDGPKLVLCDHQRRIVQQVYPHDFSLSEQDIEEEVSISLNSPIVAAPEFDFSKIQVSQLQQGLIFKSNRVEMVGPYETSVYSLKNLTYTQKTRDEHLSVHPLPLFQLSASSNTSIAASLRPSKPQLAVVNSDDWASEDAPPQETIPISSVPADLNIPSDKPLDQLKAYRPSLNPPPLQSVTWEDFCNPSKKLALGRVHSVKESQKQISATLWMYNPDDGKPAEPDSSSLLGWVAKMAVDAAIGSTTSPGLTSQQDASKPTSFPIKLKTLLPLLDLMGMRNDHVRSLKDFLSVKLPPGFPVKIEIPINVLPLSAVVTFANVKVRGTQEDPAQFLSDSLFVIPGKRMGYLKGDVVEGTHGFADQRKDFLQG
ncbi:hypothetical protein CcCBS67573_g02307 [Chytriomyces confervae]|uniref:Ankyrin repeat domain-containing protein n=1 Tax=Chytriomyces confervae TaxID=246404 RepID=A0A507FL56_9FUNG|nr:hypothetical protein CcCBS67573_g02307 [Chytriomyces confervae]